MTVKWQKQGKSELESVKLWNEYVPKHLLPRLHGYELMMAPYAIAHMKIGLKLFETGYQFKSNERVRVYLTNTLEPPHDIQQQLAGILPALAHEANAVNDIKKDTFFNIIVGNPPYSHRANLLSAEQRQMINEYKSIDGHRMKVRGALQLERNLNDDYVKFLRYAQIIIDKSHYGIVGMITNNAYLENLTFPGMRNSLALTYDLIKITNLNGSTKAGGLTPEGNKDENVFEIQQGVAISILAKSIHKTSNYRQYSELWGARTDKEEILKKSQLQFENFSPEPEFYLFVPLKTKDASEYWNWKSLDQIFYYFGTGVMTNRNELTIAPTNTQLQSKINIFINSKYSDKDISDSLGLKTNALWNLHKARIEIEKIDTYKFFQQIDFRPFDTQIIFYHASAVDNMRKGLMKSIVQKGNLALIVSRQQFVQGFNHAFVTNKIFDECLLSTASREKSSGFPMHVDSSEEGGLQFHDTNRNIHDSFLSSLNTYEPNGNLVLKFNYIYSILYSENYRHRYAEHLKRGYARIPESNDLQFVINLSKLGEELISLHLLVSPKLNKSMTVYAGKGDSTILKKPIWKDNAIWINTEQRFEGVPENVWKFHIGGYQVCEKWLKDRKGRTLSDEDIKHYQRIVLALNETIRIMAEIDRVIDEHGGWPGAFNTGDTARSLIKSNGANIRRKIT
jgi:predicted helicase